MTQQAWRWNIDWCALQPDEDALVWRMRAKGISFDEICATLLHNRREASK